MSMRARGAGAARVLAVLVLSGVAGCADGAGPVGPGGDTPGPGAGQGWRSIAAGYHHTCAVTTAGKAYCWGRGGHPSADGSALGNGLRANTSELVAVSGQHSWSSVSAGDESTCGITTGGDAYCWGEHMLGDGRRSGSDAPTLVSGGHSWALISDAGHHKCGITTAAEAYCWGVNSYGQIGNGARSGNFGDGSDHVFVPHRLPGSWSEISAEQSTSCGVTTDGKGYCWGADQWSTGASIATLQPKQLPGDHEWTMVSANYRTWRALTSSGDVYRWRNDFGSERIATGLGLISLTRTDGSYGLTAGGAIYSLGGQGAAAEVFGGHTWTHLSQGFSHVCGLTATGKAYCWGTNSHGELGPNAPSVGEQAVSWDLVEIPLP